ncbi:MAG: glycosyltransferase [Xanthomonadaceae bacterium]|nr:glycosyltransferase [Xanthomonadaceae bacterium]
MKKILIDARMIHEFPHGIARYVEGLAIGLKSRKLDYELVFLVSARTPKTSSVFLFQTLVAQSIFLSPAEWLEIPKILNQNKFNAFHSPSLSAYPYLPVPYMVTIHDLNHLHFGSIAQKIYYFSLLKRFAKNARVLSTISEFSKKEIDGWLRGSRTDIQIVSNPFEKVDVDTLSLTSSAPKTGYFLSISGLKDHKNLKTLLAGYQAYRNSVDKPFPLYVTADAQGEGVTSLSSLTNSTELMSWMKFSRGCLFPSLYEGFGRAPVEAAIAQSRIALSDISPHREGMMGVSEESLVWVNPTSSFAWSGALLELHHEKKRPVSSTESLQLQAKFSPDKIANDLDPIYRNMLIV